MSDERRFSAMTLWTTGADRCARDIDGLGAGVAGEAIVIRKSKRKATGRARGRGASQT